MIIFSLWSFLSGILSDSPRFFFFLLLYMHVFLFCSFSSSKAAKQVCRGRKDEHQEREDRDARERERQKIRGSAGDWASLRNAEPQDTQNKDIKKAKPPTTITSIINRPWPLNRTFCEALLCLSLWEFESNTVNLCIAIITDWLIIMWKWFTTDLLLM